MKNKDVLSDFREKVERCHNTTCEYCDEQNCIHKVANNVITTIQNNTINEVLEIIEDVRRDANLGYMFDMVAEIKNRVEALRNHESERK